MLSKLLIGGGLLSLITCAALATVMVHSNYLNGVDEAVVQPLPFSHQHHVQGLGLDCRYCHTSVEKSSSGDFPDTATCMTCHSQIWTQTKMLEPVRNAYAQNKSLPWIKVHELPDYVYFNHSIHVQQGIGCATCHGEVGKSPKIMQAKTFFMKDCLECHTHPEKFIRPREEVFNEDWHPINQAELGKKLVKDYGIPYLPLTNCNVCHR